MRWRAAAGLCVVGLGLGACAVAPRPTPQAPVSASTTNTDTILTETARLYATVRTYADTGTAIRVTTDDGEAKGSTSTTRFMTSFDRASGSFRFEHVTDDGYADDGGEEARVVDRRVVWRSGNGLAHVWWSLDPATDEELELIAAVGDDFADVGGTASALVAPRLFGEPARCDCGEGYVLEGEESFGGVPSRKLVAREGPDREFTLWIGKDDHAVHGYRERMHFDGVFSEAKVACLLRLLPEADRAAQREYYRRPHPYVFDVKLEFHPVFDRPIPAAAFEFTSPAQTSK